MSEDRKWLCVLGSIALLIALLMQGPQIRHMLDTRYEGVLVRLNSDEDVYLARVSEALNGRGSQTDEAIIGDPTLGGTQSALLERVIGTVFRPTGLRAATVLQILDSVFPPLLFLTLFWFFLLCGFTRLQSLAGAVLFILMELYNLNRPIHQTGSYLITLLAFIGIMKGLEGARVWGFVGGALLGLLTYIYFWGFTYAWAWFGVLFLWEVAWAFYGVRGHSRKVWARFQRFVKRKKKDAIPQWQLLLLFGGVGLLVAVPFFVSTVQLMIHPLYEVGIFRSGIHSSRLPESVIYSGLFLVMTLGIVAMIKTQLGPILKHKYAAVTVCTSFLVINQQIIHGVTFNFVSHYLFAMIVAALCVVLLWVATRSPVLLFSLFAAVIYLSGITYDGRHIISQWSPEKHNFERQHLASTLPVLDALPRSTILSDVDTSQFLAGATKHDVVYSLYLKNVLMAHEEVAERYCATQLPLAPDSKVIAENPHLIYPDALSAFRDPALRADEEKMVMEACDVQEEDLAGVLSKFGVDYVLFDEKHQPLWYLPRLGVSLEIVDRGNGWSLWAI